MAVFAGISEVAAELDVPTHVLRFWEARFGQVRPVKRAGGRRHYRAEDVDLLRGIKHLLHGLGYTIRGAQRLMKERGAEAVRALGRGEVEAGAPAMDQALTVTVRVPAEGIEPDEMADVQAAVQETAELLQAGVIGSDDGDVLSALAVRLSRRSVRMTALPAAVAALRGAFEQGALVEAHGVGRA